MAFREDLERVLELVYMSPICPYTVYTFHVKDEKKTGRASVLLHHILGYEGTSTEEGRYWVISQVKDYDDVLMFLNVLLLVMEKLDHLTAMKTTQDYLWYCQEGIYNRILEKVTHHASLKGAHKQVWIFTHRFDFVKLGDNLGHHGHDFEDIMSAYNALHKDGSSYIQCIIRLVTDIEAMTEFKHSLKWYRLRHKNRGILRDSASLHNHGL